MLMRLYKENDATKKPISFSHHFQPIDDGITMCQRKETIKECPALISFFKCDSINDCHFQCSHRKVHLNPTSVLLPWGKLS